MVGVVGFAPTVSCSQSRRVWLLRYTPEMVSVAGFAPATFCSRSRRATELRYTLMKWSGWWESHPPLPVPQTGALLLSHSPKKMGKGLATGCFSFGGNSRHALLP